MSTEIVSELATFLLRSNALQFGVFKLSSGKDSPYYIDLRMVPSFPKHFRMTVLGLKDKLSKIDLDFDCIASVPTSGLIFASALAYETLKPLVYVRKESKSHGTGKLVEGFLKPGSKVLLIDDVATTGISIGNAAKIIRANGGIVEYVISIMNRLEGADEKLSEMKINLVSHVTINEVVNVLYKQGLIDENTLESVLKQVREESESD